MISTLNYPSHQNKKKPPCFINPSHFFHNTTFSVPSDFPTRS